MRRPDDRPTAGPADAAGATDGVDGAAVVAATLDALDAAVGRLAGVDATTLPEDCVAGTVRRLAKVDGRLDGITARLVSAAEAAGTPEAAGAGSTTNWVAEQTGRSRYRAARTGQLAATAGTNPEVADAVADGTVGPDQAGRIATGLDRGTLDPADAADLLAHAGHLPPTQFNREASRLEGRRHQRRLRRQETAASDARYFSSWRTDDGSLAFKGQLPGVDGDRLDKALNAFVSPDPEDVPDDQRRTPRQLRADALVDLADAVLTNRPTPQTGTVRPHVTVTVPMSAMAALADAQAAGTTAVSDCDTVLSADAFRRLACDATFRRLVLDADSMPLDVGRATRRWSSSQRAAVVAVDGGCRGPGCDLPADRCEIHHIRWWVRDNGETNIDEGALYCKRHHDLIHDEVIEVVMDPQTRICTYTTLAQGTTRTTHPRGAAAPNISGLDVDTRGDPPGGTDPPGADPPMLDLDL